MKARDTERLTFDAPKELARAIRGQAMKDGVSMADVIRLLIKKSLNAESASKTEARTRA